MTQAAEATGVSLRETAPPLSHETSLSELPGIGAKRANALAKLGLWQLRDLLEYLPREYRFESGERGIDQLVHDQVQTVRGRVIAVDYIPARPRSRFEATLIDLGATDTPHKLAVVWFNGAWLRNKITPGMTIRVRGRVRTFRNIPQMANPKWEPADEEGLPVDADVFRPIYPATADLSSELIEKLVADHLDAIVAPVEEWFDPALLHKRRLLGRAEAYRKIHRPADATEAFEARRRLVYDELMMLQLGLGMNKRLNEGRISAPILRIDAALDSRIRSRFPFEMTGAQTNAAWQIVHDLKSGKPMNRLLQGDVGSGKTVVALYAMLVAVANKLQCVMLAPTEVLAAQHFLTLSRFLADTKVNLQLVTGRTKRGAGKGAKDAMLEALADGRIDIAVGTQALLQQDVDFANLGLVVVDEQHKLGVKQRAHLREKGVSPHYLVMTATPIPRTLALSYLADFDVSTIDELPPGRQPIETRRLRGRDAKQAYKFVRRQVEEGRQAYIVLPQIDDDGLGDVKSVEKHFAELQKGPLEGLRLGMLHGRLAAEEKDDVMRRFRTGELDVLVATTVIEVGVDVPNATTMVIENAERFGLSQLHQLRGRVGRGSEKSYCVLISDAENGDTVERLDAMCRTTDGFELAEVDLQLRGPGDFFGTRQHGLPSLKIADVREELDMLQLAREDALALLDRDPTLRRPEHTRLRQALMDRYGQTLQLANVG